MSGVISREVIARQAAAAAEMSARTGEVVLNPYSKDLEPEHHEEFARRFYVALQRVTVPAESDGSA